MSQATESRPRPQFSVVLPIYNESGNIEELYRRLTTVFSLKLATSYELLFVDDGSRDDSYAKAKNLHAQDPEHVRVIKFSRNFGHHMAVTAGLDHARGEKVVMMDSDLQDLPEEIPTLNAKLDEGYDMVYGIRRNNKFSFFKRLMSDAFRLLMAKVLKYEVTGGIFRILRRPMVDQIRLCRERDRMIDGLIAWTGFRHCGTPVEHGARHAGETSYTLRKQIKLALNSITAFSTLPLQIASWIGMSMSALSFLAIVWIVLRKLIWNLGLPGWSSTMVLVAFIGGIQLFCIGVLGEYVARIFRETRNRPLYVIETEL